MQHGSDDDKTEPGAIFRAAPTGIGVVRDRVILDVNDRICAMTGYARDELVGQTARMFYPTEEDFATVGQEKYRQIATAGTGTVHTRWRRKDGSILSVLLSSTPLQPGKVDGKVVFTALDVTESLRTEQERQRLIEILERTNVLVSTATVDGEITYVNRPGLDLLGWGPDLEGKRIADLHPPWALAIIEGEGMPTAVKRGLWNGETALRRADGEEVAVSQVIMAHTAPAGRVRFFSTIMRDITQEKRSEEALRTSEERFRSIVEGTPSAIYLYSLRSDDRLVLTGANPAANKIIGITHENLLGRTIEEAFPKLASTQIPNLYREVAKGRLGPQSFEVQYSDDRFSGYYDVMVFRTEPNSIAVNFTEVSERKRAEAERERLQGQVLQGQKVEAIGRLAGGVAHDLNNLLTPILGYAEILRKDIGDESLAGMVESILQAGRGARNLVQQLLAFARKQTLERKPLHLNAVVEGLSSLLRRTIRENVVIDLDLDPKVGMVMADAGQIEQVIMNLSINAQDAMPGGGKITLSTAPFHPDRSEPVHGVESRPHVLLSVADTGHGMDEATMHLVFEPFFTTKGELGTGLGLATVYGIVRQHGGRIWVESELGIGTTFKILLPVASPPVVAEETPVRPCPDVRGSETILLVEDDEQVRRLVYEMLTRMGYRVLPTASGKEAIETLESNQGPVHLLVTDVVMPDMDGHETHTKIVERSPSTRVLYMSGYTDDTIARHGVQEEGIHFIHKPFSLEDFGRVVRSILDEP
jgi:PAS domain S-box-containing protein